MKWKWAALVWVALVFAGLLLTPGVALGWPQRIDITATGSDNASVPGCIVSFNATLVTNFHVTCNWTVSNNADGYLVYAKFGSAPSAVGDGYLVDNTTLLGCDDFSVDLSLTDEELWYGIWAFNVNGYSTCDTNDYVQGGAAMSLALTNLGSIFLFLGITGLGVGLLYFSWWTRIGAAAVATAVLWFVMGCYCVATGVISGYTLNTVLGIILVMIAFIAVVLPVIWKRPSLPDEESSYTSLGEERDAGGEQPLNQMKRSDKVRDSGRLSTKQLDKEYADIRRQAQRRRDAYNDVD